MIHPLLFITPLASAILSAEPRDVQQPLVSEASPEGTACDSLSSRFPTQIAFAGDPLYNDTQADYWILQQTDLSPSCRVFPSHSEDVQDALAILISHNSTFAVVSGGHSTNVGASNAESPGVTIDLSSMDEVALTDQGEAVHFGPGARWSNVYAALEPHGLTVAGSRVSAVGIGGYVLGGGLSWFADQVGWSCDNVLEVEIVTPDCQILRLDHTTHADLFWAVKGSLGAFGIVTSIKMKTVKDGSTIYAGGITFEQKYNPALFAAVAEAARDAETDTFTQAYASFSYLQSTGSFSYMAYLVNTQAYNSTPTLVNFQSIPNKHSTLRETTVAKSAEELADSNPLGFRRAKFTLTTLPTVEMMRGLHQLAQDAAESIDFDPEGILSVTFQPLGLPHLRTQGNIFAHRLASSQGPLLLVSAEMWWQDPSKDHYFEEQMDILYDAYVWAVQVMGIWHPWVYPNYAAKWQDPFGEASLGSETVKRLQGVRERYDSKGRWRELVPGIWHF